MEMKGSHDQFSIQNVDPQKSLLSELINKKENEDLYIFCMVFIV